MKLLFLGTGAADFSAQLNSDHSFGVRDKSVRRSSSCLVDNRLLLDCGPHTFSALDIFGADKKDVTDLFITHTHSDHFDLQSISMLACGRKSPLRVWCLEGADVCGLDKVDGVELNFVRVGEAFDVGNYTVVPLKANHTHFAVHYYIVKNGKKFLYATDGAWMLNESYNYLKGAQLDCMAIDATVGDYQGDYRMAEHNSLPMIRMMEKSLRTVDILKPQTQIVLTHIARTLHPPHAEVCASVKTDGYIVAYDGLILEI